MNREGDKTREEEFAICDLRFAICFASPSQIANRKSQISWVALAVSIFVSTCAFAQNDSPKMAEHAGVVRGDEITPQQQAAVDRGLERLASHQKPDGTFGNNADGFGTISAVTALSGLAFMESGSLPNRGKYGPNVQKCVDAILAASQ